MNPTQSPTQEPVQIPTPISVPPTKPNWILIILSVFSVILLVLIVFLSLQNQQLKKQSVNQQISPTIQVPSPVSQSIYPTPVVDIRLNPEPIPSSIVDPTATWKVYTNNQVGFELRYPMDKLKLIENPTKLVKEPLKNFS